MAQSQVFDRGKSAETPITVQPAHQSPVDEPKKIWSYAQNGEHRFGVEFVSLVPFGIMDTQAKVYDRGKSPESSAHMGNKQSAPMDSLVTTENDRSGSQVTTHSSEVQIGTVGEPSDPIPSEIFTAAGTCQDDHHSCLIRTMDLPVDIVLEPEEPKPPDIKGCVIG
jgi:hypothetical protein